MAYGYSKPKAKTPVKPKAKPKTKVAIGGKLKPKKSTGKKA